MKNLKLLLLPFGGCAIFTIALTLPVNYIIARSILMGIAGLMTLVFYFITLSRVIKAFSRDASRQLFWLVAIICVPVVGNVIYVIFSETANKSQSPHGVW